MGSLGNAGYIYHLYGRDALIGSVSDDTELAQFDHWSYDDPEVTLTVKDPVKPYQADFFLPNHDVTVTAHWKDESGGASSGGDGGSSSSPRHAVDLAPTEHGAVTVSPRSARKGDTVTVTAEPDSGYTLDSLTVTDRNGKELKLTGKDGAYTFLMPASGVTVSAVFAKVRTAPAFGDIPAVAYYADAIAWVAEQGITGGVGGGLFGPDQPCTRGQIVTFLWRAADSPAPKGTASVPADVLPGSYCAEAVAWTVESGVTQGTTDTTFSPSGRCTRAQIVTFLWRLYTK